MARSVTIPLGSWPLEMRAEHAAGYCGEPSVQSFCAKVEKGLYHQPARVKGCMPKWHRAKLDQDIARRHGIRPSNVLAEDVTGLI
jgi:hypothetical protein